MWPKLHNYVLKALYTILICLVFLFYFIINRNLTPKFDLSIFVDNLIPFSPPFAFLYVSYLGLLWGSLMYGITCMSLKDYKRFILSLVVVQAIAYIFYILIPGTIPRPAVDSNTFGADLVNLIRIVDRATNLFPSLHVANSWLIALTLTKKWYAKSFLIIWALLIIASTLFVKQHFLMDTISGLLLSTAVYYIFEKYAKL